MVGGLWDHSYWLMTVYHSIILETHRLMCMGEHKTENAHAKEETGVPQDGY